MMRRSALGLMMLLLASICWPSAKAEPPGEAAIHPFVRGSFAAILKAGQGHPHIINFWSIGCPPCLAEMPMLQSLLKNHPGLRLTMISTDSMDDIKRIRQMLAKHAPAISATWVFADSFVERLRHEVDSTWSGELPRTYLAGANGKAEMKSGLLHQSGLLAWLEGQAK